MHDLISNVEITLVNNLTVLICFRIQARTRRGRARTSRLDWRLQRRICLQASFHFWTGSDVRSQRAGVRNPLEAMNVCFGNWWPWGHAKSQLDSGEKQHFIQETLRYWRVTRVEYFMGKWLYSNCIELLSSVQEGRIFAVDVYISANYAFACIQIVLRIKGIEIALQNIGSLFHFRIRSSDKGDTWMNENWVRRKGCRHLVGTFERNFGLMIPIGFPRVPRTAWTSWCVEVQCLMQCTCQIFVFFLILQAIKWSLFNISCTK